MGKRGPSKKLAQLDKLDGNPSNRKILDLGIIATGQVFIPDHLCDDAQGCVEVIKQSMPPDVYARVDSFMLAAFATAWAVHKRASHELNNPDFEWLKPSSKGTLVKNPWVDILRGAAADMAKLGDRLGLSPTARAALHLPKDDEQPKSKFAGLIGQTVSSHS